MELFEALSIYTPVHQTPAEQMPVTLEPLPAWKQLIVESRQLQTAAELLTGQSKRQIMLAKRRIVLLRLLRRRLRDSRLWHSTDTPLLHCSEDDGTERCFLFSADEEGIVVFSQQA